MLLRSGPGRTRAAVLPTAVKPERTRDGARYSDSRDLSGVHIRFAWPALWLIADKLKLSNFIQSLRGGCAMSDRYSDPRKEERRTRVEKDLDDPQTERTRRRGSARDVRSSSSDFLSSWCGLWENLLSGVGDFIAPPRSRSRSAGRSTDLDDEGGRSSQSVPGCEAWEFSIRCGRPGESESSRDTSKAEEAPARSAASDRIAEVDTSSKTT